MRVLMACLIVASCAPLSAPSPASQIPLPDVAASLSAVAIPSTPVPVSEAADEWLVVAFDDIPTDLAIEALHLAGRTPVHRLLATNNVLRLSPSRWSMPRLMAWIAEVTGLVAQRSSDGWLLVSQESGQRLARANHGVARLDLTHADPSSVAAAVRAVSEDDVDAAVMSPHGSSLLISGSEHAIKRYMAIAQSLDLVTPQVEIEAWVVETTQTLDDALGLAFDSLGSASVSGGLADGGLVADGLSSVVTSIVHTDVARGLRTRLRGLRRSSAGTLIANPRILAAQAQPSEIFLGSEVPYVTTSERLGQRTEFRQAGLRMTATPQSVSQGSITLTLEIALDDVSQTSASPTIARRRFTTTVSLASGSIAVVGGLRFGRDGRGYTGVPLPGGVIGLGGRTRERSDLRLLVFLSVRTIAA